MDKYLKRITNLKTIEECDSITKNFRDHKREDLALEAEKRKITLKAEEYQTESKIEKKAIEAILAYQESKGTYASRTWPMLPKYGVLGTVERILQRKEETLGYKSLLEKGLEDFSFEAVVMMYPDSFSDAAIKIASSRISKRNKETCSI